VTAPETSGAPLPIDPDVDPDVDGSGIRDAEPGQPTTVEARQPTTVEAVRERPLHLRPLFILYVFCGGALGTFARYAVALALPTWWALPWPTFAVNIVGAFLLGALLDGLARRGRDHGLRRALRLLIGTGFMGGFTTYSSLAVDGAQLFQADRAWAAIGYLLVTLVVGAAATALGILVAGAHHRSVLRRTAAEGRS